MNESFLEKSIYGKSIYIRGKRGQITTFVIIGILVVVMAVGTYYFRDIIIPRGLSPKDIQVPEQAESVKLYVESCFDKSLRDAVNLIGSQGGYIELPGDVINVGEFTNRLKLFGNNEVIYWYYKADNNVDYIQVPNIKSMENEISNYIENNLVKCLGVFNEYDGFQIKKGRIKTETDISNARVVSKITFPLEIKKGDFEFKFSEFYSSLDVPLGDLYSVAKRIFDMEEDDLFFEKKTLDIMSFYEQIPLLGETNDCVAPIWVIENVRSDLKSILRDNIPFFRVRGTNYILQDKRRNFFEMDVSMEDKNVDANFLFSTLWPFEIKVYPEKDGLLKGKSVTEALGKARGIAESFVCLSTYEFLYDIKYPILVILNKNDYGFQFATMVVIDRNKPRKNDDVFLTFEGYDQRFCNGQTEFIVDTVDTNFNNLDQVEITYQCINHRCKIGRSENGVWNGKVPYCINGKFIGEKGGYHSGKTEVSTNERGSTFVVLEKLKTLDVEVLVNRAGSGKFEEGEKAHIQLEEQDKDYSTFVLYPEQKRINLIPGNYKVKLLLIKSQPGFKIDEKEVTECFEVPRGAIGGVLGLTEEKCQTITIPGVTVDQLVTGTEEFSFFVTEEDLTKNKIVFYVPYHGIINDVTELSKLTNQKTVLPEFK